MVKVVDLLASHRTISKYPVSHGIRTHIRSKSRKPRTRQLNGKDRVPRPSFSQVSGEWIRQVSVVRKRKIFSGAYDFPAP